MRIHVRTLTAGTLLACSLATAGCRTGPVESEVRATFGEVAVVSSAEPCTIDMAHPTAGWGAGLAVGGARGLGAIVVWPGAVLTSGGMSGGGGSGGGEAQAVAVLACMAVAAAAAVVWTPFSMIGGAVTAIPVDAADAAEQVLVAAATDPAHAERVGALVAAGAARWSGHAPVATDAAQTVVTVRLVAIERGRSWNWWTLDRSFPIEIEVRATVTRRADGSVLWAKTYETEDLGFTPFARPGKSSPSGERTYLEWAADGGAPARREIEAQLQMVGELCAWHVFGVKPE